jgi:hypothetical protein
MSATPTLRQVITELHRLFAGVPGLAKLDENGNPVNLLRYEPRVIQVTPTLYTLLDSFQRDTSGQVTAMRYRILHRVVLQWQDNAESEAALEPLIQAVPAAVDADPTLGGLLEKGVARIGDGSTGFVVISNTKYRCIDFFSDVLTKGPYRSGI